METCIICKSQIKKINNFVYKCNKCLFLKSDLQSGYGREVEGINDLRKQNFKKIIKVIKTFNKSGEIKILEIGSGSGIFLEECNHENIYVLGTEADNEQVNNLKKKFPNISQIKLPLEKVDDLDFGKFDYVIFNDVFEHLEKLDEVIQQLEYFLKDEGKIVINLPSSDGIIYKFANILNKLGIGNFYNRLWQKGLSSPHLSYFNNHNLSWLFKNHNFELVYSNYLNTVSRYGNYKRLNSTINNKIICIGLNFFIVIFFYIQKILPKDIIFHIYQKKRDLIKVNVKK